MSFLNIFYIILITIFLFNNASANTGNITIQHFYKSKQILREIHKENSVTLYCQCKYDNNKPIWESCGFAPKNNKKRASRIEWEHVLPASYFGTKFDSWNLGHPSCTSKKGKKYKGRKCTEKINIKFRKMQADLYNLQPVIGEVNLLRSNYQIAIINGENRDFGECDIEIKNNKVEPNEKIRGDIARTYMYMELNYPKYIKFNNKLKTLIIKWDKKDPIDNWECKRAKKIQTIQGNPNSIILKRCNNKYYE